MNDPRYPIGRFQPPAEFTAAVRAELIGQIEDAPARVRAGVQGLTADRLQTPYRDGGWTLAQVVHHLADSHMNAYVRFRLALTEDEPTIKAYQEARWAELPDAASSDVAPSVAILDGVHQRWGRLLRQLTPDQWARSFQHPERGRAQLERDLALYAWHGRHHVAHITTTRERLGW